MQAGDAAECQRYVEAAEKGIRELDSRETASSDDQTPSLPQGPQMANVIPAVAWMFT